MGSHIGHGTTGAGGPRSLHLPVPKRKGYYVKERPRPGFLPLAEAIQKIKDKENK